MSEHATTVKARAIAAARLAGWVLLVTAPLVWLGLYRAPGISRDKLQLRADRFGSLLSNAPRALLWLLGLAAVGFLLSKLGGHGARLWRALGDRLDILAPRKSTRRWLIVWLPVAAVLLALPAVRASLVATSAATGDSSRLLSFEKYVDFFVLLGLWTTLSIGLNITVGFAGLLVLGYASFWAIGAYTYAILSQHGVSMWASAPVAVLISGLLGFALGLPSLRLRGDYLALVTLGFGETVRFLLKNLSGLSGGEPGLRIKTIPNGFTLQGYQVDSTLLMLWLAAALVFASIFATRRLHDSRIGRAWVAIREDELAASCMGISTTRYKLLAFTLSAIWAGLAGVLYAGHVGFVDPESFKFDESVKVLSMVVLGGIGSVEGAMLGAFLLYGLDWLMKDQFSEFSDYRLLVFGAIMVVLMIFRPQGLLGSERRRIELTGDAEGESEEGPVEDPPVAPAPVAAPAGGAA